MTGLADFSVGEDHPRQSAAPGAVGLTPSFESAIKLSPKSDPDLGPYLEYFTESLILAQDERWRRA
ncbi:MAG: hypothetical protein Kow00122_16260 [Thermoleophilia bacterium]